MLTRWTKTNTSLDLCLLVVGERWREKSVVSLYVSLTANHCITDVVARTTMKLYSLFLFPLPHLHTLLLHPFQFSYLSLVPPISSVIYSSSSNDDLCVIYSFCFATSSCFFDHHLSVSFMLHYIVTGFIVC